jgi:hypothetical protein
VVPPSFPARLAHGLAPAANGADPERPNGAEGRSVLGSREVFSEGAPRGFQPWPRSLVVGSLAYSARSLPLNSRRRQPTLTDERRIRVGKRGLEPPTPTMSTWCSNQLSYLPDVPVSIQEVGGASKNPGARTRAIAF